MFKLVGFLVVVLGSFSLGFYVGHQNIPDMKEAVMNVSRYALDTAMGLGPKRQLQWRGRLVEAKARIVQAKSELMDRNFGTARRELDRALTALETASEAGSEPPQRATLRILTTEVRDIRGKIKSGQPVSQSTLNDIQKELDLLLSK